MHIATTSMAVAILGCAVFAQTSLVSPVGFDTKEGNGNNTYPFYDTFHYMQIHGDLRNKVLLIKGQSFRRDGNLSGSYASRTLEIEIFMGNSDLSKISSTFANNYLGTRTMVLKKTMVNTPSWATKPATPPAAFDFSLPFGSAWVYTGTTDLVWEWVVHSTTAPRKVYPADSVSTGRAVTGPYTRLGVGCTATGQTRVMLATAYLQTYRSPDRVRYYCYTSYGRANSTAATLLGLTNPNATFPICGPKRVYTDAMLTIPATSSATGFFNSGTSLYFPWNPALTGMKTYSQTYTLDGNQSPLPVAVSNGVESTVPVLGPKPGAFARIYALGNPTALSGGVGSGYALVTRFDG